MSKKPTFFWQSYADLMTSLFFIMLVLYALTFVILQTNYKTTKAKLDKIKEIQTAVNQLPQKYFIYQPEYKRFVLNTPVPFAVRSSVIQPKYYGVIKEIGNAIVDRIDSLKVKYGKNDIKYLIVIEGMSSNIPFNLNFELSYARALSIYRFWDSVGIKFDPNVCELQIAGSGTKGVGRNKKNDLMNQRILIQIIPKIGEMK